MDKKITPIPESEKWNFITIEELQTTSRALLRTLEEINKIGAEASERRAKDEIEYKELLQKMITWLGESQISEKQLQGMFKRLLEKKESDETLTPLDELNIKKIELLSKIENQVKSNLLFAAQALAAQVNILTELIQTVWDEAQQLEDLEEKEE